MEFLNIGGGELIVIVLLAIVLFGPEDILKIMRTIGGYVRKLQQMWAQVSSSLQGEFSDDIIPEDIQETIKETRESVAEVQKTLAEVTTLAKADLDDTITAVSEIKASLDTDIGEIKTTAAEIETSLVDATSSIKTSVEEIPQAIAALTTTNSTPATPIPEEKASVSPAPVSPDATSSAIDDPEAQTAEVTGASEDK